MTITVSVPDQLAQETQRREESKRTRVWPGPLSPEEAVDDIRELRKGVTLGGLKIRDLINEGRKY